MFWREGVAAKLADKQEFNKCCIMKQCYITKIDGSIRNSWVRYLIMMEKFRASKIIKGGKSDFIPLLL
jgi:hypothetical protein